MGDRTIEVPVKKTNTKEEVATAIDARINLDKTLPFASTVAAEVVTLTARNAGLIAGDIVIVTKDLLSTNVTTVGVGDPDISQTIIDGVGDQAFEYWISPYIDDTRIDALTDILDERWNPIKSLYGHLFSVAGGTVAELKAIGERPNNQHLTIVGVRSSVSSLAATLVAYVGTAAQSFSIDPARPVQTLELRAIDNVKPQDEFNYTESTELLHSGISPLTYESGAPTIVRCITTFIVNKFGANDISYLDVNTLVTLARIIRHLKQVITSKFARVKLVDDGTIISAGSQTVSPRIIRNEMLGAYDVLISEGIAENAVKFEENLIVERNQNDPNRLDVILPPDLVNQLRIFAVSVQFRLNFGV
jgi:phage tail sheath gpL-like